jgi:hypothetical protein
VTADTLSTSAEESQLNRLRLARINFREFLERIIEGDNV